MMTTLFQSPAAAFLRASRDGWDRGASILRYLGGTTIELAGTRAAAQTR